MVIKLNGTQGKKQKFPMILAIYVVLCCTTLPGNLCHGTITLVQENYILSYMPGLSHTSEPHTLWDPLVCE